MERDDPRGAAAGPAPVATPPGECAERPRRAGAAPLRPPLASITGAERCGGGPARRADPPVRAPAGAGVGGARGTAGGRILKDRMEIVRAALSAPVHREWRAVYTAALVTWIGESAFFLIGRIGPLVSDMASYWAAGTDDMRTHVLGSYWPPLYPLLTVPFHDWGGPAARMCGPEPPWAGRTHGAVPPGPRGRDGRSAAQRWHDPPRPPTSLVPARRPGVRAPRSRHRPAPARCAATAGFRPAGVPVSKGPAAWPLRNSSAPWRSRGVVRLEAGLVGRTPPVGGCRKCYCPNGGDPAGKVHVHSRDDAAEGAAAPVGAVYRLVAERRHGV